MDTLTQQPQIRTRTEYAMRRANCTERLVAYIITGERKGTGPLGKKVKAALLEYDTIIASQLQKPLHIPTSSA